MLTTQFFTHEGDEYEVEFFYTPSDIQGAFCIDEEELEFTSLKINEQDFTKFLKSADYCYWLEETLIEKRNKGIL